MGKFKKTLPLSPRGHGQVKGITMSTQTITEIAMC